MTTITKKTLLLACIALWVALQVAPGMCAEVPDAKAVPVNTNLEIERKSQFEDLGEQVKSPRAWFDKVAGQAFRAEALLLKDDKGPADVVLRRTEALLADLSGAIEAYEHEKFASQLREIRKAIEQAGAQADAPPVTKLFADLCRLRRRIAFANPLLDFDKILFMKGHLAKVDHSCAQYFGHYAKPGGGVYVLSKPFGDNPRLTDLLGSAAVTRGRLKGGPLQGGSFRSLSLSYDASTVFFAYAQCDESKPKWSNERSWHVFKALADGTGLEQLTDGTWNDFDPCLLPNGRLAFISERRGGFGRCHNEPQPTYTLFSMRQDGNDIVPLSYHETNEWNPSVNHDGMIVYTRWDYVDRGDCIAHHPWITFPDGRDPRPIQGNYPIARNARPDTEMHVRAIPGSNKYVSTASGHHRQNYGSLVIIDPSVEDDGAMSAVRRLTPEIPFPEVEGDGYVYGTAWPLSEKYYLCVYSPGGRDKLGIYLLDAFGNKELLYRDPEINCIHPIPLRPQIKPPVIPHMTAVGNPDATSTSAGAGADAPTTGMVACMDVYAGLKPWPKGTRIKALRVVQVFPKTTPLGNSPPIGVADEALTRGSLGTAPVESDGSAYFAVPAGKTIYFQALDEEGFAVQSMMSATYVHPGETLGCQGCHEPRHAAPATPSKTPLAFRRPPSALRPDVEESYPVSFPRLVQPVLDKYCVRCHQENAQKKAPVLTAERSDRRNEWSKSFMSLVPYAYGESGKPVDRQPVRTTPGEFGARASKLYQLLKKGHYDLKMPPADMRRIVIWLDLNSNYYGDYKHTAEQARGEQVMPELE